MHLVIAEKPSVAQSIARVIGAKYNRFGHLEANGYLVSWCIGHLVELATPEDYDEKKQDMAAERLQWQGASTMKAGSHGCCT